MQKCSSRKSAPTTKSSALSAMVSHIEREFEKQAPGFNQLPIATRTKHVKKVLYDAREEIEKEETEKYQSLEKIAGISPNSGQHEAIGFDGEERLVHLLGIAVKRITVRESVRAFRKIEERWIGCDGAADWHQDDDARLRWFRMVEKALN